ncbi:hypothetical protein CRM22_001580 [Opisthorchis felineus]|uniref:Ig-like domain-containing protein n=1 Tax=Opisthorchis felineus TaxID=147828 RepID=A0A4S2M9Z5_OPIFE|nr:hypothetical protein CRM22_001580 [Opisthorchis felineus]
MTKSDPSKVVLICLVYILHSEAAEPSVVFEPANGMVHVGTAETITCSLQADPSKPEGTFGLVDLKTTTDLISLDNDTAKIKPPADPGTYTNVGSTTVQCIFTKTDDQSKVEGSITVRVLPAKLEGTLDGGASVNPVLQVGDTKELQCDLLPPGTADKLAGEWGATLDEAGQNCAAVAVAEQKAKIKPIKAEGYTEPCSFNVTCAFSATGGDQMYAFTQRVDVVGVKGWPSVTPWITAMGTLIFGLQGTQC